MTTDGGAPIQNEVGLMFMQISEALNECAASTEMSDHRIAPAIALLSKINSEYLSQPGQAQTDANSLAGQIHSLLASHPDVEGLADAAECAEQLAGTWAGPDYV
jgi:hypothetical protein